MIKEKLALVEWKIVPIRGIEWFLDISAQSCLRSKPVNRMLFDSLFLILVFFKENTALNTMLSSIFQNMIN